MECIDYGSVFSILPHQTGPDLEILTLSCTKFSRSQAPLVYPQKILYWGTIYNKGMGFFWEKTSRAKLITHLFPSFGVDPPTAIALSQTAIVTPRPRTNTLTCLRKICSSWGRDGIPSASRACYCILGCR